MRFFLITCHRGHCGRGHSIEITFAIQAMNLIAAQNQARKMPAVKHTRGIIYGREITRQQYIEYRSISAYNR